ncbi:MAG: VCBS domain-containing protein, partial [Sheuella sp.]|nr:VCBS domain-containing protein [Sheuella sp.]
MADANTSTTQQAQDARTLDDLTSLQQPGVGDQPLLQPDAGDHVDTAASHTTTQSQDGPSLYNNAPIQAPLQASSSGFILETDQSQVSDSVNVIRDAGAADAVSGLVVTALVGGAEAVGLADVNDGGDASTGSSSPASNSSSGLMPNAQGGPRSVNRTGAQATSSTTSEEGGTEKSLVSEMAETRSNATVTQEAASVTAPSSTTIPGLLLTETVPSQTLVLSSASTTTAGQSSTSVSADGSTANTQVDQVVMETPISTTPIAPSPEPSNQPAVITGTSTASLTESNAVLTASGSLSASDLDSSAAFVVQTGAAGSNGYGVFSIDAAGAWTYTANTAHNEFVAGTNYTDSTTVATADGTTQVITVTIAGTNDAAVITGTSTASLTETNAALTASGTLTATDVDSSAAFVAQTGAAGSNGYGVFSIDAAGAWTYTANTAHNEFVAG